MNCFIFEGHISIRQEGLESKGAHISIKLMIPILRQYELVLCIGSVYLCPKYKLYIYAAVLPCARFSLFLFSWLSNYLIIFNSYFAGNSQSLV